MSKLFYMLLLISVIGCNEISKTEDTQLPSKLQIVIDSLVSINKLYNEFAYVRFDENGKEIEKFSNLKDTTERAHLLNYTIHYALAKMGYDSSSKIDSIGPTLHFSMNNVLGGGIHNHLKLAGGNDSILQMLEDIGFATQGRFNGQLTFNQSKNLIKSTLYSNSTLGLKKRFMSMFEKQRQIFYRWNFGAPSIINWGLNIYNGETVFYFFKAPKQSCMAPCRYQNHRSIFSAFYNIEPPKRRLLPAVGFGQGDTTVYTIVEKMPEFQGGEEEFFRYLRENIKYPATKKDEHLPSKFMFTFIVDSTGSVVNPKMEKINGYYNKEIEESFIKMIKGMPKWTPGEQRGRKVNVKYNMPVNIHPR